MSNTNINLQTQTSNALYNAIMEASGKDRPPMLTPVAEGSLETITEGYMENYNNVSQDIRDQLNAKAEAVQIILAWIDNVIYSTVDACPNACEIWKAIGRSQPAATKSRGKATVNSPPPTYDQEPTMVAEDDEMSTEKEIDKLMDLISLSFKKIYKPTNNNLRTSSNTSRENQDNTLRINRGTGYDNQRVVNVAGDRKNVGTQEEEAIIQLSAEQADWRDETDDKPDDQELESHYMYMERIQEVTPDAADNSGPIFDAEPLKNVQNNDDNYNVFVTKSKHPEKPESINDTYPIEQDEHNIIIDLLDMGYDREQH
uniref:Gag-Pol polyprotein n=1 Tax=Tanacetum cinerariifolium TaxID=118510 RepID=A0A6L2NAV4_TANCI|nr:hypothetical protein [Tanacetum cinerariifolium]